MQPTSLLCGSVLGEGSERAECHCLISGGLPTTCSVSSHFTHFLYGTGALPDIALVVNPRVGGFTYDLSPCAPFKQSLLKSSSFFYCPNPHWFSQSEVVGIYLPRAGNLGCTVWPGAGTTCSQGIPPNFYPLHMSVGPPVLLLLLPLHATPHLCASLPISTIPPLLPVWMNVASSNPWLSDFHTARFSDSSGCYLL